MRKKRNSRVNIVFSVVILMIIGIVYENLMMDKELKELTLKGEVYNINSHDISTYSIGEGESTVVFIPGSGTPCAYTDFYYLQKNIKDYAKTLSFDHSGYGWSGETGTPRTIDILVDEMKELFEKSKQEPPYILVAHSLASLQAIRYAQIYPKEVKGIILLDGGSPEYYSKGVQGSAWFMNRSLALMRTVGVIRALGEIGIQLPIAGERMRYELLPDEIKNIEKTMYYCKAGAKSNISLIENINDNAEVVVEKGPLEDVPLIIRSSDNGEKWDEVQKQLLSWSNDCEQIRIKNAKHYIHWSHGDIVVNKIIEIIRR